MSIIHSLFCVTGKHYKEGPGDLWDAKDKILTDRLPTLVNLYPLYLSCNAFFWGTSRREFETHVASISSCHPCNFCVIAQEVVTGEYEGAHIVCSHRIVFVPFNVAHFVLKIIPNGLSSSITKVVCRAYRLLTRATSCALEGSGN